MPAFYSIDKERRIVFSSGTGALTREDILDHQDRLLSDPDFDPTFSQFIDFTGVTDFKMGPDDVLFLAERNVFSPKSRRALLVGSDLLYGFARMFEMVRDAKGETGIRVFRNRDGALAWAFKGEEVS